MRIPLAAALAAVLLVPAAAAQFSAVATGDAADGKPLQTINAALGFIDSNSNGRAEASMPDEPVYLDLDGSRSVTYGDIRLTGFLDYPAATTVDAANLDLGRTLALPTGWLASTPQGAWLFDLDGSRSITAGDVRLTPSFGMRAKADDSDARTGLEAAQAQTSASVRVGYVDVDADGVKDASEAVYFDLDPNGSPGFGRASQGDLRLAPTGPGIDDAITRAEFEEALAKAGVQQQNGTYQRTVVERETASSWGTPETLLLVLGLANLVGLAFVYTRVRDGGRPRNPFK